jgi:LemA protein
MKVFGFVVLGILALLIGGLGMAACAGVGMYNDLQTLNKEVDGRWAQVENVYQRRMDLIPNLVETVKGYANFEHDTFKDVAEARAKVGQMKMSVDNLSQANLDKMTQMQNSLGGAVNRLMVQAAENYPQLQANEGFRDLRAELAGTENRIAVERREFNKAAQKFNTEIVLFPKSFVANFAGMKEKPLFKAEEGANHAPKVDFSPKK